MEPKLLQSEIKNKMEKEIKYKGKIITKLHPSGMFEFYSDSEGRFIKSDNLDHIKTLINKELSESKKITISEFKNIIKEEVQKLQKRAILENEKSKLLEELGMIENYPAGTNEDPNAPWNQVDAEYENYFTLEYLNNNPSEITNIDDLDMVTAKAYTTQGTFEVGFDALAEYAPGYAKTLIQYASTEDSSLEPIINQVIKDYFDYENPELNNEL